MLVLRYYKDRTEAQTAELLGIGVGTVKSTTGRHLPGYGWWRRTWATWWGRRDDAELHDLMHRLADDASPVAVADDTWARARRARRRGQVAAPALALALLLGVVTVGLQPDWLPGRSEVAPTAPVAAGEGAVPHHVYAVPDRLEQRREDDIWSTPRENVSAVPGPRQAT